MKILAIQDYLRVGGTERQFLDLTRRWSKAGHEVTRLVFRRGGPLEEVLPEEERRALYHLQPIATPIHWWAPRLRRFVRDRSPDRIICMGRNAHCAAGRSLLSEYATRLMATHRTGRVLPGSYRKVLRQSPCVVANSSYAARRAVEEGASKESIHLVPNGCLLPDGEDDPIEKERLRARAGVLPNEIIYLCMGSFVPGKNQKALLDLWAGLSKEVRQTSHLWFVGEGKCRPDCTRRAKQLPAAERIRFWGNQLDPLPFYRAADVAVSSSLEESFPNFVVEAQWMGLPVVATECAGLTEHIENQITGHCCSNDKVGKEAFADWWGRLHHNADLRAAWGSKAKEYARTHFDPEVRAQAYLHYFREMK